MDEDLKRMLQEQFSIAYGEGNVGVAKLYAELRLEMDKQLEFFMKKEEEN